MDQKIPTLKESMGEILKDLMENFLKAISEEMFGRSLEDFAMESL